MRVTNNMLVNTLLRNVNNNLSTMQKKQDQLSTGKRVSRPSDDPVAVSKIIKYKTDINELKQYDRNTKDALSWTQTSELAIADISTALQRTRELAVQAANGTNTIEEREKIAMEIKQLKEHIIGNGNKTFAGKYIFSSYQTDQKLLNDDGTFNINITQNTLDNKPVTTYEVGIGETMKVSTNGLDLFGAVIEDNYFTQNIPSEVIEGVPSKKSIIKGTFNLEENYIGDTLEIEIDGTTYTVDDTNFDGSTNALEKNTVLAKFKAAGGGGNSLSDVADVFFDSEDQLVIQSKTNNNINISSNFTHFNPEPIAVSSKGMFNLINDYTGETMDVTFDDGVSVDHPITYYVDESVLDGSGTSLTESEVISAYENAINTGSPATTLKEYANVFFKSGKLVIQPKAKGNINITQNTISGEYKPIQTVGRDTVEAKIIGTTNINDADVLAETGTYELLVIYNDNVEKISIDMDSLFTNDAAGFNTAIQNELDSKFGAGNLQANISDGNPFEIETINTPNNGSTPKLEVRTIKSQTPQIIKDLDDFITALESDDQAGIDDFIGNVDINLENINSSRSEIGAKTNRLEMILSRIEDDNINVTQLLSNNQDVDMAETIMTLKNAENVYKASLSAGARVIQPSLLDFLR
ncbi:MAG: flagellar hook-associated protein FlgL [Bacillota bacterium]|nr:flagellar hook-associated protein FlgL [Bacillota bacterium]